MLNKFEFLWVSCPLLPISLTRGQCIQAGKFWGGKEAGARASRLASQRSRTLHQSISIPSFTTACSPVFAQVWEAVTGWAQGGMRLGTENMLHTALGNKTERERDLSWFLFSSVQFSCSVMSDSLRPHESQHARPPGPSPTPGVYSNLCPLSQWRYPTISSSVVPFSSCPQSLPASGSFPMSQFFALGGVKTNMSKELYQNLLCQNIVPTNFKFLKFLRTFWSKYQQTPVTHKEKN